MLNAVATIILPEFTVTRIVNKVERVRTATNTTRNGNKAERGASVAHDINSQWTGGHFVSLLATFRGALGPMVDDCLTGSAKMLNVACAIHGEVGTFDAAKPNRVLVTIALGEVINVLEAKSEKARVAAIKAGRVAKGLTGENLYWHGVAKDLTAQAAAAVQAKADAAAKLALDKASAPSAT